MQTNQPLIFIVYHVAVMGNWAQVVKEQLALLESSGLGTACQQLCVQICGAKTPAQAEAAKAHFQGYGFSQKIRFSVFDALESYEFPSIKQAQETARQNPTAKILYFHTKGVSHPVATQFVNGAQVKKWDDRQVANMVQWRKVMEYFLLKQWRSCVRELDQWDCCGVDWVKPDYRPGYFFSGNFWWANAEYILRCNLRCWKRFDAEYFIGSGAPRAKELFSAYHNPVLKQYLNPSQLENLKHTVNLDPATPMFQWWNHYYENKYFMEAADLNDLR